MSWLDLKYVDLLGPRLRNFQRKGPRTRVFSCPLCGDSKTDKGKARGYLYEKKGDYWFFCHNGCGGQKFPSLLSKVAPDLYREYRYEKLKDEPGVERELPEEKPVIKSGDDPLRGLVRMDTLSRGDDALEYFLKRQIPKQWLTELYVSNDFNEYSNRLRPDRHRRDPSHVERRIIIPCWNWKRRRVTQVQCRAIGKSDLRYVGITLTDEDLSIFNLNRVNLNQRVYAFEGPIDSMFIENSVAVLGGTMTSKLSAASEFDPRNTVVVFDNEKNNSQVKRNVIKSSEAGWPVCVWPSYLQEKDVNDMVLSGKSPGDVADIIDQNTYYTPNRVRAAMLLHGY